MLPICGDVILQICESLTDREKIRLTMISKMMDTLKYKIIYCEKIDMNKIVDLSYFNSFECVQMYDTYFKHINYPKHVKYIHFKYANIPLVIPQLVTHLTFDSGFNAPLKNHIPSSVTHLNFGMCFNHPLHGIPISVTHLTFGLRFNQPLDGIPSSITHLTFGWNFNQPLDGKIPPSVTHLTFGACFNKSIKDNIPPSVTHLKFGEHFNQTIDDSIPLSVIEITLYAGYHGSFLDRSVAARVKISIFNYQ